jgi:hypothetical protein
MSILKPAFSTDLGSVYNADCIDLLALLPKETVDTIFADPPFTLSKDYGNGKDKDDLLRGDYLNWCYQWMDEMCESAEARRVDIRPQPSPVGLSSSGSPGRARFEVPPQDRYFDEGYFSKRQKVVSGPLCTALLYEGGPSHVQPRAPCDPVMPPLRKGHQGLRRTPQIPESPRPESD